MSSFRSRHALVVAVAALLVPTAAAATTVPDATESGDGDVATTPLPLTGSNPAECVDGWVGEPLFPDQFKVRFADQYELTYHDNYKVLDVAATYPGGPDESYVLVQCGTDAPALDGDLAGATVIEIPVATIFSASSSHLGFIDALGLNDRLTGFGQPDAVVLPAIRERIADGDVVGFAPNYEVDAEAVIAADPDVFISGGYDDPAFDGLRGAGIPILGNSEWLETSPKGWAEWVGVFAALTNTEAAASELYEGWLDEYDAAAALVAPISSRPSVIDGSMWQGTWYMAAGNSIRATFIADAGGHYLFGDNDRTGTVEADVETLLAEGIDAHVWVGVSDYFTSRSEAIAIDERYGAFAAWDNLGVFTTAVAPDPTVSFAESGPTMIGPYLLDFVKAFHPGLAEDHEFVFLAQIPAD